jgi:N-acetylglucosamine-6-phosphate deacetylase
MYLKVVADVKGDMSVIHSNLKTSGTVSFLASLATEPHQISQFATACRVAQLAFSTILAARPILGIPYAEPQWFI